MAEVHWGVTAALVGLRFIHVLAAALWVGGGLLFLYVIAPLAGPSDRVDLSARLGRLMANTVGVFLLSGVALIFARLPGPNLSGLYVGLLAFKLALAGTAFFLVWRDGAVLPQRLRRHLSLARRHCAAGLGWRPGPERWPTSSRWSFSFWLSRAKVSPGHIPPALTNRICRFCPRRLKN